MSDRRSPPSSASPPADEIALGAALRRLAAAEPPWLHIEVARRMAERLQLIRRQPATIVDCWGHLGAGAALLAQAYPRARRVVVEPTDALAERSRRALPRRAWTDWGRAPRAEVRRDDPAPESADLLWANMMLHRVVDPAGLIAGWLRALRVDGFAMFSCLGPGSLAGLREVYRRHGWGTPAQDFLDMHDLGDMLVHAGFADPVMDQETLTLTWDDPRALLAELRGLGGNASNARFAGLRTPRWQAALARALGTLGGAGGRPRLDFEIVYGHAFKAAPRMPVADTTRIGVDALRAHLRGPRGRP